MGEGGRLKRERGIAERAIHPSAAVEVFLSRHFSASEKIYGEPKRYTNLDDLARLIEVKDVRL